MGLTLKRSIIFACLIVFAFSSCGKDSVNPVDSGETHEYGSIVVRVVDEHENPLEGIVVDVNPKNVDTIPYLFSGADGIARFDSITPGEYDVLSSNIWRGYPLVPEAPMMEHHIYDVSVSERDTVELTLHYPIEPLDMPVKAVLTSDINSDTDDIQVYFADFDSTLSLDEKGAGVLTDIDLEEHLTPEATVIRHDMTGTGLCYLSTDSNGWPYYTVLISYYPVLEIVTPQDESKFAYGHVLLRGAGYDFEDGDLPGNALSWHSSLDGDLGIGSEITPDLSVGRHTITLTGRDSVEYTSADSIIVNISHYADQSYFPLPQDGIWKYHHNPADLVVVNEKGETEHWTLEDMVVLSDDINARVCRMDWCVKCDGKEAVCRYVLKDHLVIDGNRFLVTATDELLTVYDGNEQLEELIVETSYAPYYPLLTDYLDPRADNAEEVAVTSESALKYTIAGVGTRSRIETATFSVSYETGSPEEVTTDTGAITAVPLHSMYDGVERTWWLARGIGIVKMVYDLLGETVNASLYETNMGDFLNGNVQKLPAGYPVHVTLDAIDKGERLRELSGLMRSMCPR